MKAGEACVIVAAFVVLIPLLYIVMILLAVLWKDIFGEDVK